MKVCPSHQRPIEQSGLADLLGDDIAQRVVGLLAPRDVARLACVNRACHRDLTRRHPAGDIIEVFARQTGRTANDPPRPLLPSAALRQRDGDTPLKMSRADRREARMLAAWQARTQSAKRDPLRLHLDGDEFSLGLRQAHQASVLFDRAAAALFPSPDIQEMHGIARESSADPSAASTATLAGEIDAFATHRTRHGPLAAALRLREGLEYDDVGPFGFFTLPAAALPTPNVDALARWVELGAPVLAAYHGHTLVEHAEAGRAYWKTLLFAPRVGAFDAAVGVLEGAAAGIVAARQKAISPKKGQMPPACGEISRPTASPRRLWAWLRRSKNSWLASRLPASPSG